MTNRPNSVISESVFPGISDHDAAQIELDIKPIRVHKKPRDVPLYRSAKWDDFKEFVTSTCNEILSAPGDADVNDLWIKFRDAIQEGIKQFIPHRQQKAKVGLPYMTPELRKSIRRRDRLYDRIKKARKSVSMHEHAASLRTKYKKLKQEVQKQISKAYWNYVASVITPPVLS